MSQMDSPDPLYNRIDYSTNSNPTEIECWNLLLDWNIDFSKKVITGKATHEVCLLKDGVPSANFDISGLIISKVLLDNERATFTVTEAGPNSVVKVTIPAAQQVKGTVVKIEFQYSTGEEASAMQWLDATATQGGKYPYLFTQSQAIHARSMFPCFDSPGVKTPYSATVRAPAWCTVLMSALSDGPAISEGSRRVFKWSQPVPVPAYLVALAAGQLASVDISPRVRVWSEPASVEAAAWEFHQTEEFLQAAEQLTCEYQWKRYDILNLPPSFPYGGMENPCLTFATPTLLAGDRSLANVIAHEIAHSWTGNLVTNATWSHFWLNEGWTVWVRVYLYYYYYYQISICLVSSLIYMYIPFLLNVCIHWQLERNIMQLVTGSKDKYKLSAQGGHKHLEDDLQRLSPEWSSLVWPLRPGSDPDDAFSSVPYEKGFALLAYLESLVGEPSFKEFVRAYVKEFKFSTVTSGQFRDFFCGYFSERADLRALDWTTLFTAQGLPQHPLVDLSNPLADAAGALVNKIVKLDATVGDYASLPSIQGWSTDQKTLFLDKLLERASTAPLRELTLIKLNQVYGLNTVRNAEIKFRWQMVCLKSAVPWIFPLVTEFVLSQGRMKFVRPLYRALRDASPTGEALAIETFTKNSKM